MKKLEYTLDTNTFDTCIFGTGLTEALFAASLAKIDQKKILIVDCDEGYSSSQKTLNLKELNKQMHQNSQQTNLKKQIFTTLDLDEEQQNKNIQFITQNVEESQKYRGFNIDLQPKLLFSHSLTIDCMKQADMDKYMDFRAINSIFCFDSQHQKLIESPCSKSDIFKSKYFTLSEKKQLFQFLHTCMKLFNNEATNQNSTNEFDKEFSVDEKTKLLFEKRKDQNCLSFLNEKISSQKIKDIFLYNICNYEFNPTLPVPSFIEKDYTAESFVNRIKKYIQSCGIHTKLPYLYTNYGTGDIPQAFARISAVFGSIYCINPSIEITQIEQNQEDKSFLLTTNLVKDDKKLKTKCIIAGAEYKDMLKQLLGIPQNPPEEEVQLLRVVIICKKSKEQTEAEKNSQEDSQEDEENNENKHSDKLKLPTLFTVPPNDLIGIKQPLSILQLDNYSVSTPKEFQVFHCKKVMECKEEYKVEVKKIIEFIRNIKQYSEYHSTFEYEVDYVLAYSQSRNSNGKHEFHFDEKNDFKVSLIGQEYFEIDMDKNFEEFRNNIEKISVNIKNCEENYFQTTSEIKGIDKKYSDNEETDQINVILNKFEELKKNEEKVSVQKQEETILENCLKGETHEEEKFESIQNNIEEQKIQNLE